MRSVRAIGYVRRSGKSECRAVSLETQCAVITRYAQEKGATLAAILEDDGVSGANRARLERIERALNEHCAQAVIVYHLDRFARDVAAQLDTLRAWSRRRVELHVVDRGRVEIDSATGFLQTGVEALLAEHYRRLISEKTRDALTRLRDQGRRYSGQIPYGYRLIHQNNLTVHPGEQAVLARIKALKQQGLSVRKIAEVLRTEGVHARNGRPFAPSTLHGILRKEVVPMGV